MAIGAPVTPLPPTPAACLSYIESKILSGDWPAGMKLPSERHLAEDFGVSRTVVREVLKTLQAQRLIDAFPGRGSYVTELRPTSGRASIDQFMRRGHITTRDLITARRMLESEAAALAALNRTPEELEVMRELLAAFDVEPSVQAAVDLDAAFHEAVVVASHNPVVQIMFGSIRALVRAMILRSLTDRRTRQVGAPIHHDILGALEAGDANAARAAMAAHISVSETMYGADLDLPLADVLNQRAVTHQAHAELLRGFSAAIKGMD